MPTEHERWSPGDPDTTQEHHGNIRHATEAHWDVGPGGTLVGSLTAELAFDTGTSELTRDAPFTATFDLPIRAALESGQHTLTEHGSWAPERARRDDEPADPLVGAILDGRYRLVSVLGRGGMSAVYRGEHLGLGTPVAVKVLKRRLAESPAHVDQFLFEARTTAMIRHPNVIDVIDVGFLADGVRPFLVLELLEGEDLQSILRRERALPWPRARAMALQICAALEAAHRRGVIHRDIKPHNCFVARADEGVPGAFGAADDGVGRVVLLDFGIAKLTARGEPGALTSQGDTFGTVEYLAPERALDQPIDHRSDIYSLGVVLYRMLTGYVPFYSADALAVARAHVSLPPQPLRAITPDAAIPPQLEDIVLRALAKDPDERFQTAGELAAALRAIPEPSGAAPAPSRPRRPARAGAADEDWSAADGEVGGGGRDADAATGAPDLAAAGRATSRRWLARALAIAAAAVALVAASAVWSIL